MSGKKRKTKKPIRNGEKIHAVTAISESAVNFGIFIVGLGFCAVILAMNKPQMNEVARLEAELKEVQENERVVLLEKDRVQREREALRDEPAYLEMVARDKLDLQMEEETIIRIKR